MERPQVLDRRESAAREGAIDRAVVIADELRHISHLDAAREFLIVTALMQWYHRGMQDAIDRVQRER